MSDERAERLRQWHEQAYLGGQRTETITFTHLGWTFEVPPDVYPPNPLGLADLALNEVRPEDRVLDMGTGSGVNAIAAASKSKHVVAVDISPAAVECARDNADRNGMPWIDVRASDLFQNVDGQFDLIAFDPPFRWFRPRDVREQATADENYRALTQFFQHVGDRLSPGGRVLLSFGTTGDIDYLKTLIDGVPFKVEELRRVDLTKDALPVSYFAYRLTL